MDDYSVVIIVTIIGFSALAAILLVPVYLFLKKEEEVADRWTQEALSKGDGNVLFELSEEAARESLQVENRMPDRAQ